jgi:hypothetical protein
MKDDKGVEKSEVIFRMLAEATNLKTDRDRLAHASRVAKAIDDLYMEGYADGFGDGVKQQIEGEGVA